MNRDKCIVCKSTRSKLNDLKFFRFPKDEERCKAWVLACNLHSRLSVPAIAMYKRYRICSKHFQVHDYASTKMDRLKSTACPSKFESFGNIKISELKESLKNKLSVMVPSGSVKGDESQLSSKTSECEDIQVCLPVLTSTPKRRPHFIEELSDLSEVSCVDSNAETTLGGPTASNLKLNGGTPKWKNNFTEQLTDLSEVSCVDSNAETTLDGPTASNLKLNVGTPKRKNNFTECGNKRLILDKTCNSIPKTTKIKFLNRKVRYLNKNIQQLPEDKSKSSVLKKIKSIVQPVIYNAIESQIQQTGVAKNGRISILIMLP